MQCLKSLARKTNTSDEKLFYWIRLLSPNLLKNITREYKFCNRKFRFDFAFVEEKIAIECDGGTKLIKTKTGKLVAGRHSSDKDYEKRNLAALHGWKMLAFTSIQINNDPKKCVEIIEEMYLKCKKKK